MFGDNYLIGNVPGRKIFESIRNLPIIDPHNHLDIPNLLRNEPYPDLWALFGQTDHYVWEVMRKCGIPEEFITGNATPEAKFLQLANHFEDLIGNPVYEWIHLDLRFMGITKELNSRNGKTIWQQGNLLLSQKEFRPMEILKRQNVEMMCSTDDPADDLSIHIRANDHLEGTVKICPTWRPDRILKLNAPDFPNYCRKLSERWNMPLNTLDQCINLLQRAHDYFADCDCRASDHGMECALSGCGDWQLAAQTFRERLQGEFVSPERLLNCQNVLFGELCRMNQEKDWVTQLHLGPVRDVRKTLLQNLGPDSGGDVSSLMQNHLPQLIELFNKFDESLHFVLYSLEPAQYPTLAALSRAFGEKIHLGSAWWLADSPIGMMRQLEYIGSVDLLSCFAGMVSDSRKLLSFHSRFSMFRRVLAHVLGEMVTKEQCSLPGAIRLAEKIALTNPRKLFSSKTEQ